MIPVKPPASVRHLLVCTNVREPDAPKPSCGRHGGAELRDALKKRVKEAGLKGRLKVTAVGCLDYCPAEGVAVGFYPENTFHIVDAESDAEALWEALIEGVAGSTPSGSSSTPSSGGSSGAG
jgi:predicted metal-binding protein